MRNSCISPGVIAPHIRYYHPLIQFRSPRTLPRLLLQAGLLTNDRLSFTISPFTPPKRRRGFLVVVVGLLSTVLVDKRTTSRFQEFFFLRLPVGIEGWAFAVGSNAYSVAAVRCKPVSGGVVARAVVPKSNLQAKSEKLSTA